MTKHYKIFALLFNLSILSLVGYTQQFNPGGTLYSEESLDCPEDTDGDGVCDDLDPCPLDNPDDSDGDGVCDSNDICFGNDASGDSDGDGICDNLDQCDGDDASGDSDNDGICDDMDLCFGPDSSGDTDGDGICDAFDPCPLDNPNDSDFDGICDSNDICFGNDATGDSDNDGVCDNLDMCNGDDASGDSDNDGVCDNLDICNGGDDTIDEDEDGIPDFCDTCIGDNNTGDDDGDGICNDLDICPDGDDTIDVDNDGSPDACDLCQGDDNTGDSDGDGVCDDFDPCPLDNPNDSDGDGVCDSNDICFGTDSTGDSDGDGICDNLDLCDGNDATGDSDGDGICDEFDNCPNDPLKTEPGICGCGELEPGTPCDDGNLCTIDDVITEDCKCEGTDISPEISINFKNESCPGMGDGNITITIDEGTPPYQYSIDNGQTYLPEEPTNETIWNVNSLEPGFYAMRIKSGDCETAAQAVIVGAGVDDTPPTANCIDNTIILPLGGTYELDPEDVLDLENTFDNCEVYSIEGIFPSEVDCDVAGTTVGVTVLLRDPSGNVASCFSDIEVIDPEELPSPWEEDLIGGAVGEASYTLCAAEEGGIYISSTGFSFPNSDKLHFVHQELCGDGEITAHLQYVAYGGWAGLMMRETLAPGSKKAALKTQLSSFVQRELRTATNGFELNQQIFRPGAQWFRIQRSGPLFLGYTSFDGINWQFAFFSIIQMDECIEVGPFVEGFSPFFESEALFDQVIVSGGIEPLTSDEENYLESLELDLTSSDSEKANPQIYPNPTSGIININLPDRIEVPVSIHVFNLLGQAVLQKDWAENDTRVDLSALKKGVYLIELKVNGQTSTTQRIILQ